MSRWEEVYDAQIDLVAGLDHGFQSVQVPAFMQSFNRTAPTLDFTQISGGSSLAWKLGVQAFNADPIYVEPEMQTVWEAAAEAWQPEPLHPTDLITAAGFCLFPRPLVVTDIGGNRLTTRAVLWHPASFDLPDDREVFERTGNEEQHPTSLMGRDDNMLSVVVTEKGAGWEFNGVLLTLWHHTRDYDDLHPELDRQMPSGLILQHVMPWAYGASYASADDPRSIVRPVQALWRLMQQTIADVGQERPGGQFRKRWERARMPEKKVTIVRLRRPRREPGDDHEPRTVDWSHRWLVGGHWRNQWYPSLSLHRQVWISPYVKGPEDKPLEPKRLRVFKLVR